MPLKSKLPDVGTTIFTVMSQMAAEYNALNLSQGFPDFRISPKLIELVNRHMKQGYNQYAPMPGLPALREQIAEMIYNCYQSKVDPYKEITITAGATEAIYATITALIGNGDEVMLFDPAYDCYAPAIRLNGGVPIHIPLTQPDFSINWEVVKNKLGANTKLIIINSPHNPSGAVLSQSDLKTLEEIAAKHDLLVLSDEVYEYIIFGQQHESVLKYDALRKRCIAVSSFGKTFHATGWKIGYLVAPEEITNEIRKVHQYLVFSVNTPMQHALAGYLKEPDHYLHIAEMYNNKRKFFVDSLAQSKFEIIPSYGTYFQLLSYKNISDLDDMSMAAKLTKENKLASIPISVFYQNKEDNKLLRFCFAKNEETLERAAEILCKI